MWLSRQALMLWPPRREALQKLLTSALQVLPSSIGLAVQDLAVQEEGELL